MHINNSITHEHWFVGKTWKQFELIAYKYLRFCSLLEEVWCKERNLRKEGSRWFDNKVKQTGRDRVNAKHRNWKRKNIEIRRQGRENMETWKRERQMEYRGNRRFCELWDSSLHVCNTCNYKLILIICMLPQFFGFREYDDHAWYKTLLAQCTVIEECDLTMQCLIF
jgi:hypothetical protein